MPSGDARGNRIVAPASAGWIARRAGQRIGCCHATPRHAGCIGLWAVQRHAAFGTGDGRNARRRFRFQHAPDNRQHRLLAAAHRCAGRHRSRRPADGRHHLATPGAHSRHRRVRCRPCQLRAAISRPRHP